MSVQSLLCSILKWTHGSINEKECTWKAQTLRIYPPNYPRNLTCAAVLCSAPLPLNKINRTQLHTGTRVCVIAKQPSDAGNIRSDCFFLKELRHEYHTPLVDAYGRSKRINWVTINIPEHFISTLVVPFTNSDTASINKTLLKHVTTVRDLSANLLLVCLGNPDKL